jgi:hypothetical protein
MRKIKCENIVTENLYHVLVIVNLLLGDHSKGLAQIIVSLDEKVRYNFIKNNILCVPNLNFLYLGTKHYIINAITCN